MKTKYITQLVAAVLAASILPALALGNATSIRDAWTAPDLTHLSFKKVMVVATFPDAAARRAAEDALKTQFTRTECVASYRLLGAEDDIKDLNKISAAISAAGVDGVVVMRPVSDVNEVSFVPGRTFPLRYHKFSSYYNRLYALHPFFFGPDKFTTDRIVKIETNIYETAGGRLVWSAATTTTNPGDLPGLIKGAATAVRGELVKGKLISQL